jgi:hypothetical protein
VKVPPMAMAGYGGAGPSALPSLAWHWHCGTAEPWPWAGNRPAAASAGVTQLLLAGAGLRVKFQVKMKTAIRVA